LLASVILLLAEFGDKNERHIVSVFKLIQDLLAKYQPAPKAKPKMYFTKLMDKLPSEHKAKWLAGATNISRYSCWISRLTIKYLLVSSSGRTIKIADFSLQNFSASIAVPKHSICSSSESRKLFNRDNAVLITDSID